MHSSENPPNHNTEATAVSKPKRVRTGCLTCRERHLKCDEAQPICQNCRKSSRKCKRGVRLNFIDTQVERPDYLLPPTHDWKVTFEDNSREIANEYRGGLERYHPMEPEPKRQRVEVSEMSYDYGAMAAPVMSHQQLPGPSAGYQGFPDTSQSVFNVPNNQAYVDPLQQMQPYADQSSVTSQSYDQSTLADQIQDAAQPLEDRNEVLYMQVFVEEVGLWMDSMDADKPFSRTIPHQALREPMLKFACLACGIRHLTLIDPRIYPEEHALTYYNQATQLLLEKLQNPDRDSFLCATTATILNVYEVMNEKALQRMNHLAGARALIKECRWDATSTGIGAACFWLNIGLELFSCMNFNWSTSWDPDTWGIDMTMSPQHVGGNEAVWCHKILWILAKITNFRATAPRGVQDPSSPQEQVRIHQRHQQWLGLKQFCDKWMHCIPPTLHPIANVPVYKSRGKSSFPEVWYIKRTTVVARLFYHTAMALLGAVHPMAAYDKATADTMQEQRTSHSQQICGIVAHCKDRGVASASIRCLAVAGENLTVRREQDEAIEIFTRINKETGWRIQFIIDDLKEKWGWPQPGHDGINATQFYPGGAPAPPAPTRPKLPSGIPNPLYQNADFGATNPPYQGYYVPPTQGHLMHTTQLYGFSGITAI
jgi:hypothetical protein